MLIRILFSLLLACTFLSSCSLLSPAPNNNPTLYTLGTIRVSTVSNLNRNSNTLLVLPIIASPEIDSVKMAYSTMQEQIAYFAKNQWAAKPAEMLLPLVAQALRKNGNFKAVVSAPFAGSVDYKLAIQLLTLQQNFSIQPSTINVTIAAQLINDRTNKIVRAQQFHAVVPTPTDNPAGGAQAANQAVMQILNQLVEFCNV